MKDLGSSRVTSVLSDSRTLLIYWPEPFLSEITPVRVRFLNERELSCAEPALHLFLSSNSISDLTVGLSVNEPVNPVLRCKSWNEMLTMFIDAAGEIACNAYVERAGSVSHDVHPVFGHSFPSLPEFRLAPYSDTPRVSF